MIEIIPAIIAHSQDELNDKVKAVERYAKKVQLDIMDGNFVSDVTVGVEELNKIETNLEIQVHLMVTKPEDVIGLWVSVPSVTEIIFHIEATDKANEIIDIIKKGGKIAGVAINPDTSLDKLFNIMGTMSDMVPMMFVQFMTVHPGKYGSDFVEGVLPKIADFKSRYPNIPIAADGAVNNLTIKKLEDVGVSMFVSGSYIFSGIKHVDEAIEELRKIAQNI